MYEATKHFQYFVQGLPFTIYTDHKPLENAVHKKTDSLTVLQQRQLSYIAEHTSDIIHIAGKQNVLADALSRAFSVMQILHHTAPPQTMAKLREAQDIDPVLAKLRKEEPNRFSSNSFKF